MKKKPHGGKRHGSGRPKGTLRGRAETRGVSFRISPERHAAYALAAGGRLSARWIVAALDAALNSK